MNRSRCAGSAGEARVTIALGDTTACDFLTTTDRTDATRPAHQLTPDDPRACSSGRHPPEHEPRHRFRRTVWRRLRKTYTWFTTADVVRVSKMRDSSRSDSAVAPG